MCCVHISWVGARARDIQEELVCIIYNKLNTVGYSNTSELGMEKAFERLAGSGGHASGSGNTPSKGFQVLIRGIAEAKTKHVSIVLSI